MYLGHTDKDKLVWKKYNEFLALGGKLVILVNPGADFIRHNCAGPRYSGATCSGKVSRLPVKTCDVEKLFLI